MVDAGIAQNLRDVIVLTFLFAGLALAWNIAGGYAGLISFGHAAFFGIGAYTSTILLVRDGLTPWIGILVGALTCAAVAGAVLAVICARLEGPVLHPVDARLRRGRPDRRAELGVADRRAEGLSILPVSSLANMVFTSKTVYAVLMLSYLVVCYGVTKALECSRYGYYLYAVRDDEDAARAAGINPLLVRGAAMALSAALTGIGGTLFAQYFLYLDPTFMISPELSFQFALLPAVGGLGTAIGPVLGSFLITPLSELLRSYLGNAAAGLHLVIYSVGLIVVMLYFPGGLADALQRLTAFRKR